MIILFIKICNKSNKRAVNFLEFSRQYNIQNMNDCKVFEQLLKTVQNHFVFEKPPDQYITGKNQKPRCVCYIHYCSAAL